MFLQSGEETGAEGVLPEAVLGGVVQNILKHFLDGGQFLERGRDLITNTAAHSDVIITTAQVPGRPAPRLIRRGAVEAMRPGSVLVDLAAPAGGNCELTKPGETQQINGVTLLAPLNLPAEAPVDASNLYSRNVLNFLGLIVKKGELTMDLADEVLAGACVAHQGKPVNPRVAKLLEAVSTT